MNQAFYYLRTIISITLFLILIVGTGASTACEGQDLSRAKAESLIKESNEFKTLGTLSLANPTEKEPFGLNKAGESEKMEDAKLRNLQLFLTYYPKIAVANHLGLVTIEQQLVKEERAVGVQIPAQWFFAVKVQANEQGKAMWKEYSLPPVEDSIPLARKEFLTVKNITSLAETQRMAEFSWKWNVNKIGLAFQENTEEFRTLPVDIQKGLLGQTEGNRQRQTEDWSGERTGKALFQKYDDGWKLVRFY